MQCERAGGHWGEAEEATHIEGAHGARVLGSEGLADGMRSALRQKALERKGDDEPGDDEEEIDSSPRRQATQRSKVAKSVAEQANVDKVHGDDRDGAKPFNGRNLHGARYTARFFASAALLLTRQIFEST